MPLVLEFFSNIKFPEVSTAILPNEGLTGYITREGWLQQSLNSLNQEIVHDDNFYSADYCTQPHSAAITTLPPLLPIEAKSVAMIEHSMSFVKQAVNQLNRRKIPVVTIYQAVFGLPKEIVYQSTWRKISI